MLDHWFAARILLTIGMLALGNASSVHAADVPMNMVVSSTGQMRNDGKGPYSTVTGHSIKPILANRLVLSIGPILQVEPSVSHGRGPLGECSLTLQATISLFQNR